MKEKEKHQKWSSIGLAFNIVFPIIFTIVLIPDNLNYYSVTDSLQHLWSLLFFAMAICCSVLLIITGVVIIRSVIKIKNLYQENEEINQELDTKTLWLHAGAFGVYLFSIVVFVAATIVSGLIIADWVDTMYDVGVLLYMIMAFISQFLLCVIFWQLGNKVEIDDATTYATLQPVDFDESAELQARIWNSFNLAKRMMSSMLLIEGQRSKENQMMASQQYNTNN